MLRNVTCRAAKQSRGFASVSPVNSASHSHKVVVVGGGTAGQTISHQLLRTGRFAAGDIAVIDPAEWHHYQPGWTLVSGGLKKKEDLRMAMAPLMDAKFKYYAEAVGGFAPESQSLTLANGDKINYEHLVVVPGINVDTASIKGLPEALADPKSNVSTVYKYEYADKADRTIAAFTKGDALFTQPAGGIKCAGAPQKVMWLAWDRWVKSGLYNASGSSPINIAFATGLPAMFGVPKYSATLEELRKERGVEGLFAHDLLSVDGDVATFSAPEGKTVTRRFDLLHAVPKMGPHAFVKSSPLADAAGYVDVDKATLQHTSFPSVWSAGDASSAPTSKTAAAITAQAPVLVANLLSAMDGKSAQATYDGYTSCPLTTGEDAVLLAEFMYGGVPKETFAKALGIDQGIPRKPFFYLKKDFFPWVYKNYMVQGRWEGPKGWRK